MKLKNIRKYFEYFFFIVVNILLLGPVYILLLLPVPFISTQIAIKICKVPKYLIDNFDDPTAFIIGIILCVLILSFKPLIFTIIYLSKKIFPHIFILFETMRNNIKYMVCSFAFAFLADIITLFILYFILIIYNFEEIISFIPFLLFGLLFNYLSFFLFFPPYCKNNNIIPKPIKLIISFIGFTLKILIILFFLVLIGLFCFILIY